MLSVKQFRVDIVRPVLLHLEMWSKAAENLMVGTALQESGLTYLRQVGGGPALGVFQMEPKTHDDIWKNYLMFRAKILLRVNDYKNLSPSENMLIGNLNYATAMARVHYYRRSEPLPDADDIESLGEYWKYFYNTPAGAGTVEEFIENYKKGTV